MFPQYLVIWDVWGTLLSTLKGGLLTLVLNSHTLKSGQAEHTQSCSPFVKPWP